MFYNEILNILLFSQPLFWLNLSLPRCWFVCLYDYSKNNTILIKFTERAHLWHKIIKVLGMILIQKCKQEFLCHFWNDFLFFRKQTSCVSDFSDLPTASSGQSCQEYHTKKLLVIICNWRNNAHPLWKIFFDSKHLLLSVLYKISLKQRSCKQPCWSLPIRVIFKLKKMYSK